MLPANPGNRGLLSLAPGALRLVVVLAVLVLVAVAQRLAPAPAVKPLADPQPGTALDPLAPPKVFAAVGLPGVEGVAAELPVPWERLEIDPRFPQVTLGYLPWLGEDLPFAAPAADAPLVRPLVIAGHNDYHHMSFFILRAFAERLNVPYSVVNFDQHDDVRNRLRERWSGEVPEKRFIDCGTWGAWALERLPNLQHLLVVGTIAPDYMDFSTWLDSAWFGGRAELIPANPYTLYFSSAPPLGSQDARFASRDLLASLGGRDAIQLALPAWDRRPESVLERLTTDAVYVTVDLDVLTADSIDDGGWGMGAVTLEEVIRTINAIAEKHTIIGADISGFPLHKHIGRPWSHEKGLATVMRLAEALHAAMGGPTPWPAADDAPAVADAPAPEEAP